MSLKDLADRVDSVLNDQGSTAWTVDDESERKRMLALCERLRDRLESPFEKTLRILFAASSGAYTCWKYLITNSHIYRVTRQWD